MLLLLYSLRDLYNITAHDRRLGGGANLESKIATIYEDFYVF